MKRLAACLLALVLLLSGCTEGSYVSVKPHQGENTSGNAQAVAVGNYEEMLAALKEMVAGAVEQQVLSVADMDENAVTATLDQAIRTACRTDPPGNPANAHGGGYGPGGLPYPGGRERLQFQCGDAGGTV